MLRSSKEITGYPIAARDGDIGRCKDFLFDDVNWTIRYMLADTGKWIPGRKVLISPMSMDTPDWGSKRIPVRLTREQVEKAPSVRADEPVSRQHEAELLQYYGYPYYWGGEGLWGMASSPAVLAKKAA
ncbi:MAG: PRC-barrel domain-containing protein, partial [Longimicrobiales bacterium]